MQHQTNSVVSSGPAANGGFSPPATTYLCPTGYVFIPDLSPDGLAAFPSASTANPGVAHQAFYSTVCGTNLGLEGTTIPLTLVSAKQPFVLGVYTDTTSKHKLLSLGALKVQQYSCFIYVQLSHLLQPALIWTTPNYPAD